MHPKWIFVTPCTVSFRLVTAVSLKHNPVWHPVVSAAGSLRAGCRTLMGNKTPNWTTASSTAACLTFYSETRHVSVTWRKHCWLTWLLRCPWRHYKSTLPGHWYLWLNTESDIRKHQIQTDSGRERGYLWYSWESHFFNMKTKNWGKVKITLLVDSDNIYVKWLWVNWVCFSFFLFFGAIKKIEHIAIWKHGLWWLANKWLISYNKRVISLLEAGNLVKSDDWQHESKTHYAIRHNLTCLQ